MIILNHWISTYYKQNFLTTTALDSDPSFLFGGAAIKWYKKDTLWTYGDEDIPFKVRRYTICTNSIVVFFFNTILHYHALWTYGTNTISTNSIVSSLIIVLHFTKKKKMRLEVKVQHNYYIYLWDKGIRGIFLSFP